MNARKIWTELFQKPAGRLILFLLVWGIFLAFILMKRTPQPKPDNTPVASQATQAKSYSFEEDIQPLSRTQATPSPREASKIAHAAPAQTIRVGSITGIRNRSCGKKIRHTSTAEAASRNRAAGGRRRGCTSRPGSRAP